MSVVTRKLSVPSSLLVLCLIIEAFQWHCSNGVVLEDHTSFVFQRCATDKLDDTNGAYMNARSRLLQKLVSQSSKFKYNRTFIVVGDRSVASVSGLFQCRGDLDDHKCNECMKAVRNVSSGLCGNSMGARIQLSGCHVEYEAAVYEEHPVDDHPTPDAGVGVHHKICGEPLQAALPGGPIEEVRSKAFEALEAEIGEDEGVHLGFYSIKHDGVHAMAQCDVGIGECECAKCVVDSVLLLEEECPDSVSGQVFLELCYLGYEVNIHDIHAGPAEIPAHPAAPVKKGFIIGTAKLLALGVGGAVLLAIALLCCRFCKKKDDEL